MTWTVAGSGWTVVQVVPTSAQVPSNKLPAARVIESKGRFCRLGSLTTGGYRKEPCQSKLMPTQKCHLGNGVTAEHPTVGNTRLGVMNEAERWSQKGLRRRPKRGVTEKQVLSRLESSACKGQGPN